MHATLAVKRLRRLQIPRVSRLHSERFFSKKGGKKTGRTGTHLKSQHLGRRSRWDLLQAKGPHGVHNKFWQTNKQTKNQVDYRYTNTAIKAPAQGLPVCSRSTLASESWT